jgi:hypothetical protein
MSERATRRHRREGEDTDVITIRMDRSLRDRIRELAARERRSQTAQIELLLEAALEASSAG